MYSFVSLQARCDDNNEEGGCMKKKLITVLLILMGLLSSVEANAQRFGSLGKAGEGLLKTPEIMSHAARKATKSNSVSSSFKNNQIWKGGKQTFTGKYWGTTAGLITPARKVEWPTATTLSDNWKKLERRILDYDIKKKYEKSTREQVMSLVEDLLSPNTGGDKISVRTQLAEKLLSLNRGDMKAAWNQFLLLANNMVFYAGDNETSRMEIILFADVLICSVFNNLRLYILDNPWEMMSQMLSDINSLYSDKGISNNYYITRPQSSPNEPTFAPRKEKNNQQSFDATITTIPQEKNSESKSKACELLSPEDGKRWFELGNEIEELGIRLGLEKKKRLLFNKGIRFDFKKKNDLIGLNNYNGYEYEIYAA